MYAQYTTTGGLLRPRTPTSYDTDNLLGLEMFLRRNGYAARPARSSHEHGRFIKGQSLIVTFTSGAVLLQGSDVDAARQLLAPLAGG